METFVLTIWLWVGMRFEETQIPNLDRGECVERLMAIGGDRGSRDDKAKCIGSNGSVAPRPIEPELKCAYASCGWPILPPGRRRV
jgi:hypothetical protein